MKDDPSTADPSSSDPHASCLEALGRIDALRRSGSADLALRQTQPLFGKGRTPPALMADLCRLTAEAAQALKLMPLAETMWRQAALHSQTPSEAADAQLNLGVLLAALHRHDEAEACWRDALALVPEHPQALANLAVRLTDTRCFVEAEALHHRAIAVAPEVAANHSNLGVLLAATARPADAEASYRQALALAPDDAKAHTNLGLLLETQRRLDAAETHQRRALALAPHSAEIHSNLGNLLAARGREAEAEALLRQAITLAPNSAAAHNNLAVLLADQGRDDEAEALFRAALHLRPGYALARLDLSCLLLAQGRFDEGWALHEARHDPQLIDHGIPPPNVALPRWQGEPLAGRALLVWPEQGLGDQIQFCRYVPRLKAMGAARITLVCQRPLQRLFETLPGVDRVIAADVIDNAFHVADAELQGQDFWTFPLSLPRLLHTDLTTLPDAPIPYLQAAPDHATAWAERLAANDAEQDVAPRRIGLVWRGNPLHNNDAERSLPGLATLAPLWSVPGVRFIGVQTGRAGFAAAETALDAQPMLHAGHKLRDFADTAALLSTLDLLICVDTSIAHLAGALGLPCWVMLPQRKTDWRWLRGRDDSPWYPRGMRLFRQAQRGDWAEVVERLRYALGVLFSTTPPLPTPPASSDALSSITPDDWQAVLHAEPAAAAEWMRSIGRLGHAGAQAVLGQWLLDGHGVRRDAVQALHWFLLAAQQRHPMGMNMAGRCHEQGWGTAVDASKAAHWYRQALQTGLPEARYNLANLLASGDGVARDHAQAFTLYREAAAQGYAKAFAKLGRYHEDGLIVERDAAAAFDCYRHGAEGGDFRSQFCYAGMLAAQGREAEALHWLAKVIETATPRYLREAGALLVQSPNGQLRAIGEQMRARAEISLTSVTPTSA